MSATPEVTAITENDISNLEKIIDVVLKVLGYEALYILIRDYDHEALPESSSFPDAWSMILATIRGAWVQEGETLDIASEDYQRAADRFWRIQKIITLVSPTIFGAIHSGILLPHPEYPNN